jgi:hypothetical protein
MNNFENAEIYKLPDLLFLFLFIGTWLLASALVIFVCDLLGIIVNNILIGLVIGFVGALFWLLLLYFSISLIERFYKIVYKIEKEVIECK